jgi:UDP-N-acetylmuramate dehydrogenase
MDYHQLCLDLQKTFPNTLIEENHPLAPHTTLNIGGPADIFIHTKSAKELVNVLKYLSKQPNTPITILGNGSNVLISDSGLRGVVIKNTDNLIQIIDTPPVPIDFRHSYTQRNENEPEQYLDFTKLDYDESGKPQVLVKITSGTSLPVAINQLIDKSVTGLQWFAYIPGTVGGATWYNIHGGAYHFADYIDSVEIFNLKTGQIETITKGNTMNFSYETSPFQQHPEWVILSTTLRLFKGDTTLAKQVKDAWIAQKVKIQPMNSAGSVFANPSLEACMPIWGEQKSAGWIIDHELGWKGKTAGGAQISLQHSNFIINAGKATAFDYLTLLLGIQKEVRSRFNLELKPEIKLLGEI